MSTPSARTGGSLDAWFKISQRGALADKYKQTQTPRNLSIISPTGLGDRADRGISPLAQGAPEARRSEHLVIYERY